MDLGSEDRLHTWLRKQLSDQGFERLGDDGAILPAGGPWNLTVDHQIAGVHFPSDLDPARIARRTLAVNLSDLAAMGAQPRFAFLALSCPPTFDTHRFFSALLNACKHYGVELAGGDLARSHHVAAVLMVVGQLAPRGRWVRRNSGRVEDRLWLGGPVGLAPLGQHLVKRGASFVGRGIDLPRGLALSPAGQKLARRAVRRHLLPRPQLDLGAWLSRRRRAAAIDVSDGLAMDLHRLCRESQVGAEVFTSELPVDPRFDELCSALQLDPLQVLLGGGEDYVLLFAISPRLQPPAIYGCSPLGRLVAGRRLSLHDVEGTHPLPTLGWDHFGA